MEAHDSHTTAKPIRPTMPQRLRRPTNALTLSLGALLVVAVILFATMLLMRSHGGKTTLPPVGTPAGVSESQLKALAASSNHPIYWAGPKPGTYELTRTTDGRTYVRYLPSADKVGDRTPSYLTVGTYPTKQAFQAVKRAAARPGAVSAAIDHGGLLVFNSSTPKSVYFSYPKSGYQVEVYDPSPLQARALVLGGSVKAIG
ncbi:MAG: hypothetical protein E6G19_11680 [Actinobacteria bacterium]|nr:MAG: hypothetical protein E6G19_11680 [Actinomycetota bacterium]